jgi:hypothetical protein
MIMVSVAAAIMATGAVTARPVSDTAGDFHWTGAVAPNAWVRIHNISGNVRIEPGTGNSVEITGHKIVGHGADPSRVRIMLERSGPSNGDVTVCALWDATDSASCDSRFDVFHRHVHWGDNDNDVSVEFIVRLPKGVNIGAKTVNGDIAIRGATGEVESATVNGSVKGESLGGPVSAETVNGDVQITVATIVGQPHLDFRSVNGSLTVYLPAKLGAEVELTTVNGDLESDFPLTMTGHLDPHREHGTIGGGGGVAVHAETVNGSIALRQAAS